MHKVLYIDEEIKFHRKFKRFTKGCFEVETIVPHEELEDLIRYIIESDADAVIVDHNLTEFAPNLKYDGADVVREYKNIRNSFPLFILTSYDDNAIAVAEDVNCVYPKSDIEIPEDGSINKVTFNDRVRIQIEHYQKRIIDSESELLELEKKSSSETLNAREEARQIELDSFLSGEFGHSSDIAKHLKETTNTEQLRGLIELSEQLIKSIKKK